MVLARYLLDPPSVEALAVMWAQRNSSALATPVNFCFWSRLGESELFSYPSGGEGENC